MKGLILLTSIFLILIFIGCSQKVRQEEILAEFGGQVITISELGDAISKLPEWKQDKYKDQKGREEYLNEMTEDKLQSLVAKEKKLDKDPEIVKQTREYRDQLMLKELVRREVDEKVKITDEELQKYYDEHKADYVEPEKIVVTEITVKDEAKAKEIKEEIASGADFTELAKEMDAKGESYGPGQGGEGKTMPFSKDSYSSAKEFVTIAFNLQPNQISDIIVQPMGQETYYMIVRLDERIPSRQKEFSEVKDDVERSVEKNKKTERINQWLDEVKKEKKFQLFAERIPKVPEPKEEGETTEKEEQKGDQQSQQTSEIPAGEEEKPKDQGEKAK